MDIRNFFGGNSKKELHDPQSVTVLGQLDVKASINQVKEEQSLSLINTNTVTIATTITETAIESSKNGNVSELNITMSADDIALLPNDLIAFVNWLPGEAIPYLALVETFEEISKVSSRIEKENLFTKLFRAVIYTTPNDLDIIIYLASNEVFPVYDGMELGIGDSLLVKAICEATGRKKDAVEEAYEKEGDLGTVALASRANQKMLSFAAKPKPLSARFVLEQFRVITQTKGDKAQGRKVDIIKGLMVKCQGSEAKFIVRALQGKLRIGTAQQTVLVALSHAALLYQEHQIAVSLKNNQSLVDAAGNQDNNQQSMVSLKLFQPVLDSIKQDYLKITTLEESSSSVLLNQKEKDVLHDIDTVAAAGIDEVQSSDNPDTTSITTDAVAIAINSSTSETAADEGSLEISLLNILDKETPEATKLRYFFTHLYSSHHMNSNSSSNTSSSSFAKLFTNASETLQKETRLLLAEVAVKRAFSESPNLTILVRNLLSEPIYKLHRVCCLSVGVPVAPMLAKPTKQIGEVLKRLSGLAFTMEYKYDGERAQVHLLSNGTVKIFSRNSEDNSEKYPDLRDIVRVAKVEEVQSCILDAEVVAYDREQKCLLPFQILSTRKRKVEAGEEDTQKVKVILQIFDLLYLNGQSLLRESLRTRRSLMRKAFKHTEGLLHFASGLDHVENGDTAPIEIFLQEACVAQCEGLMVKTLDDNASYEPSKRSLNWLKLKKDYIDGMGVCDSVDLVVIGGYLGRGKRVNTYGAYLMACYDPDSDEYQSVCKVGTGFKDEDLSRLFSSMQQHIVPSHRRPINYNVTEVLTPDHWFEAMKVWELQAADLSKSSVHTGGAGKLESENNRGIGLRFPRFIRERDDKKATGATTAEQIVDMFYSQSTVENGAGASTSNDNEQDDDWL